MPWASPALYESISCKIGKKNIFLTCLSTLCSSLFDQRSLSRRRAASAAFGQELEGWKEPTDFWLARDQQLSQPKHHPQRRTRVMSARDELAMLKIIQPRLCALPWRDHLAPSCWYAKEVSTKEGGELGCGPDEWDCTKLKRYSWGVELKGPENRKEIGQYHCWVYAEVGWLDYSVVHLQE